MSNTITIELCAADRARIENLTAVLKRISDVEEAKLRVAVKTNRAAFTTPPAEDKADNAEISPTEAQEDSTPATTTAEEEKPTQEEPAQPVTEKTVTHDELLAKVIELSAKDLKLKAQVRDVVLAYAPRVKAVPEDKLNECYAKVVALEG